MPVTAIRVYIGGGEGIEQGLTLASDRWFNITLTLGKSRFVVVQQVCGHLTGDQGGCMAFATVVCFLVGRHRRRLAQREAMPVGAGHASSWSGHDNPGRGERHDTAPLRTILSEENNIVQVPPPVYLPAGIPLHPLRQGEAEGLRVSTGRPFLRPALRQFFNFKQSIEFLATGARTVLDHIIDTPVDYLLRRALGRPESSR